LPTEFFGIASTLGIDVLATADDHVLDPVDDPQVAVGVEDADITGVQPAVAERVGGRLGPVQVALHHVRPLDHDLATLLRRHQRAVRRHDPHALPGQGHTDRSGLAYAVDRIGRRRAGALRQSVALDQADPEPLLGRGQQLDRRGRCTTDRETDR